MPRSVQGARRALLFSVCGVELQDETIDTVAQLRADERHPLRHPARDKTHVLAQAIQLRDDDDILRFPRSASADIRIGDGPSDPNFAGLDLDPKCV